MCVCVHLYLNSHTGLEGFGSFAPIKMVEFRSKLLEIRLILVGQPPFGHNCSKFAQTCTKFRSILVGRPTNSIKIARNSMKNCRNSVDLGRPTGCMCRNVPKRAEPQICHHGQCFVRVGISIHPSDFVRKTDCDDLGISN